MKKIIRQYYELKDGGCLGIYATRKRLAYRRYAWILDVCIAKTRRQCDHWQMHQLTSPIVQGDSRGLEGLRIVYRWIQEFMKFIPEGDVILAYWLDEKRRRAFKYLERLGFSEGNYFHQPCYYWIKETKSE